MVGNYYSCRIPSVSASPSVQLSGRRKILISDRKLLERTQMQTLTMVNSSNLILQTREIQIMKDAKWKSNQFNGAGTKVAVKRRL